MSATLTFQPITVETGSHDHVGLLLFADDRLVAVLVQLHPASHDEPEFHGRWFLEAGFGPCHTIAPEPFASVEVAREWARQRVDRALA